MAPNSHKPRQFLHPRPAARLVPEADTIAFTPGQCREGGGSNDTLACGAGNDTLTGSAVRIAGASTLNLPQWNNPVLPGG